MVFHSIDYPDRRNVFFRLKKENMAGTMTDGSSDSCGFTPRVRIAVIGLAGNTVFMGVPRFHSGGETVHAVDFHSEFGGKGLNQAVAVARQGGKASFLAAIGRDDAHALHRLLEAEGVDGVLSVKDVPSAHATILTDGSGETRVTVFPGARLDAVDVGGFASRIKAADFLLLNNEVAEAVNIAAARIAVDSGVKIIFNPAPSRPLPDELKRAVSIFTPNEFEEEGLDDVSGEVITTLGAKGCRIRSTGETVPACECARPIDSTGAGDTFNAALAVRLAEGMCLRDACAVANGEAAKSVAVRYVLPSLPRRFMV